MEGMARTERIPGPRVRVRERELVEMAARSRGQHIAEFVRGVVLPAARKELAGLAEEDRPEGVQNEA